MKNLKEYSKKIVRHMIIAWFVGVVFGCAVILAELVLQYRGTGYTVHLPELLTYIGAPVSGCIIGYLVKSAFENVKKIEKNNTYEGGDRIEN